MVICGDHNQTDLPIGAQSGLHDAVGKLDGIPKISMIRFSSADVVRHPLVGKIVEAYEGPGK
jgi:phosphate starvation-inducible PhoH-like protein